MTYSIHGTAAQLIFSRTEDDIYHNFSAPGGAALLAKILAGRGLAEKVRLGRGMRKLHLELSRPEKDKGYTIAKRLGTQAGETRISTAAGNIALLWGESEAEIAPGAPVLWACHAYAPLPSAERFAPLAANCLLLIDCEVLRGAGAMISRQISWERTASELLWQLQSNPNITHLLAAKEIVVTFAEDGAARIFRDETGHLRAQMVLAHGGGEGSLRGIMPGDIDDAFVIMTAALALQAAKKQGIKLLPMLQSAQLLMKNGYTIGQLQASTYELIEDCGKETIFEIPVLSGPGVPDTWCISNSVEGARIFDIAFSQVMEGGKAIAALPKLQFGFLTTVDRWEIEAYQNIKNLITAYDDNQNPERPLSIAVFGSPGSGKSFGVTQIAKNISKKIEKIEFNVSQFTSFADLGAAFQQVRDVILQGKLPLVFFDEFDSANGNIPRGWIKYFLMPMQDGKFKDDSGEHPLGKCILVFAGGTAASFEEFIKPLGSEDKEEMQAFKDIKAPDFISRLRGTINVLGPNRKDDSDNNYILRRALLLRSLIERKLGVKEGKKATISPNVLWAMLLVPKYEHGARSMEAILDMSRIEGKEWEPVSLPSRAQLSLHVDADAFIKLVLRDVILNSYIDKIAYEFHNYYEKKYGGMPYSVPWEALPEDIKDSNRDQAREIPSFLSLIGCSYDEGDTPFKSIEVADLTDNEIELMAKHAHAVWIRSKKAAGYVYDPKRDDKANPPTHPLLVEWDRLPEGEKEKDRDIARNIIPMLKNIKLRVYRTL